MDQESWCVIHDHHEAYIQAEQHVSTLAACCQSSLRCLQGLLHLSCQRSTANPTNNIHLLLEGCTGWQGMRHWTQLVRTGARRATADVCKGL